MLKLIFLPFALLVVSIQSVDIFSSDLVECMEKFYSVVYIQKFSCSKSFNFFANDHTTKRNAFTNGKSCVLDIVKSDCSPIVNTYFQSNYEKVLDMTIVNPITTKCTDLHHQLESIRCKPAAIRIIETASHVNVSFVAKNDPELLKIINTCKDVEECAKGPCYQTGEIDKVIITTCKKSRLANTDFTQCATRINGLKPDFTKKYKCLDGEDISDKSIKTTCRRFTKSVDCMKTIMEGECGSEASIDWDNNVKILLELFKC